MSKPTYVTKLAMSAAVLTTIFQASTGNAFADTQSDIASLASSIVSLSNTVHTSSTVSPLALPIVQIASSPTFDWNQVLFGTDTLTSTQQQTASALTPSITSIATFNVTDTATATALINTVISQIQSLNSSITADQAVAFLQNLEDDALSSLLPLAGKNPTATDVEASLHGAVSEDLVSSSSSIQALFAATPQSSGGGGATGGGGSTGNDGGNSTGGGTTGGDTGNSGGTTPTPPSKPTPPAGTASKTISVNGKVISGVPNVIVSKKTTYMPLWYVMHAMDSIGVKNTWKNGTWTLTTTKNVKVNLSHIKIGKGPVRIYINGRLVQRVAGIASKDPNTGKLTTYIPIWYMMQVIKRIGFQSSWNGSNWSLHQS